MLKKILDYEEFRSNNAFTGSTRIRDLFRKVNKLKLKGYGYYVICGVRDGAVANCYDLMYMAHCTSQLHNKNNFIYIFNSNITLWFVSTFWISYKAFSLHFSNRIQCTSKKLFFKCRCFLF